MLRYVFAFAYYYRIVNLLFVFLATLGVSIHSRSVEIFAVLQALSSAQLITPIRLLSELIPSCKLNLTTHPSLQYRIQGSLILLLNACYVFVISHLRIVVALAALGLL